MERIFEKLEEINVVEENLPVNIQNMIDDLDRRTISFQKTFDELEQNGKTEEEINDELGEIDDQLDEIEENILAHIENWYGSLKQDAINVINNQGKVVEKKKSGDGWMIFGAFALVITLGAVNMFKNK